MIPSQASNPLAPQFRVLNEAQCQALFAASLECLQRIGVQVNNPEARDLLAGAGASLEGKIAHIPEKIIQEGLAAAPRSFSIWGRDGQHEMRIGPEQVNFGPGPTCTNFIDPESGARRPARRGDAGLTARVCDALENIDYVMGLSLFEDVTPVLSAAYEFAESMANTTKPVLAWAQDIGTLEGIYRMAVAVAGSEEALTRRPNFGFFATYKSPLQHTQEDLANALWAAERGIPVIYLGGPTIGLESPVTGASGITLHLATALSGLAILQLKRPGAGVVIGGVPAPMDLRTARVAYGAPEMSLYSAAEADMARYLGIPYMGTAGASESKRLDSQAAVEASFQVLLSALSGPALVHDIGFLDCADIGSLPYLVLVDEIIAMARRVLKGVKVDPEAIMLDLIAQVGPGGNFIAEPQSVALCRQEIWVPTLMDRNAYIIWEKRGAKSLEERVSERLSRILQTHQPQPLPEGVAEKFEAILTEAERRAREQEISD